MTVKKRGTSRKAGVVEVFRQLDLAAEERSLSSLRSYWFDPTIGPRTPGIEYRTVLTNGTGRAMVPVNAELE